MKKHLIVTLLALTLSACAGTAQKIAQTPPAPPTEPFRILSIVETDQVPVPLISTMGFDTKQLCLEVIPQAEAESNAFVWRRYGWKIISTALECLPESTAIEMFERMEQQSRKMYEELQKKQSI